MTPILRMRIPSASADRRSNGAFEARGPRNEKAAEDLSIDFQVQSPAHARAGFLLFRGMPSSADQFDKLLDGICFIGSEPRSQESERRDPAHIINAALA
jgi:hypothetical protein